MLQRKRLLVSEKFKNDRLTKIVLAALSKLGIQEYIRFT